MKFPSPAAVRSVAGFAISCSFAAAALAGGTPENAILIIDPGNAQSMHIGNYYKNARNIPDSNVLYIDSAATNYAEFIATNQAAFRDSITQRALTNHADFVVVAPLDAFYVPAPGIVTDGCSPVTRFSIASVYTMSQITVPNGTASILVNQYYANSDSAIGFDSEQAYLGGSPSVSGNARRYYIGAMLGYLGVQGNTVPEILSIIDRSAMVDGTRPVAQNFYFMNNLVEPLRNVRACAAAPCNVPNFYNTVRTSIVGRGGMAQVQNSFLPAAADIIGIMTGDDVLDFGAVTPFTIQPGAFCDHLTSFAAAFDIFDQTKVSAWVQRGASGSAGAVEEPCNYNGKFPHARFHSYYFQGLSLGEAYLRSVNYVPFQGLLYGDPLTRPFAYIPSVSVPDAPTGAVTGTITLTPSATTANPTGTIAGFDLLVDGVQVSSVNVGQPFTLNTVTLSDGYHDVRVLARDTTLIKNVGRWVGSIITNNFPHAASLSAGPAATQLTDTYTFNYSTSGGTIRDVRLVQNGRVLAAAATPIGSLSVFGQNLGAGASKVQIEAEFADNRIVRSAPLTVNVNPTGAPTNAQPVAFNYSKRLATPTAHLVEFPARVDSDPSTLSYTLVTGPTQATVVNPSATGAYRIIRPNAGATGSENIQFRVTNSSGQSNLATVTLIYTLPTACQADWNQSGSLDSQDFFDFITDFFASNADYNNNGSTDSQDFFDFISDFFEGCP